MLCNAAQFVGRETSADSDCDDAEEDAGTIAE